MSDIKIERTHTLGQEQARMAVQAVAKQLETDLQAKHQWQGDRLKFDCPGAHGWIIVTPGEVCVTATLSWLLIPAKGRIERSINEYLDRYLT
jgi:putative polyhydroxyalkanoate system protein